MLNQEKLVKIDVNIHVDRNLSIVQAHDISEHIEKMIRSKLGDSTINIHVEPD